MRTSGGKCDAGECGGVFGRHEREMDDVHWAGATFSAKYGTTWRPSSSSDSDVDELLGEASYIFSFAIAGGEKGGLVAGDDGEGGRETGVSVLAVRQFAIVSCRIRHSLSASSSFLPSPPLASISQQRCHHHTLHLAVIQAEVPTPASLYLRLLQQAVVSPSLPPFSEASSHPPGPPWKKDPYLASLSSGEIAQLRYSFLEILIDFR